MKIKSVELLHVLGLKSEIPKTTLPEFVMAGRSNVGKSSFINAFVNRKSLARISSSPGKTRTINYYLVNKEFYLVDLPGYGYAKTSKEEQDKWGRMVRRYLAKSENIEEVILLVDIRHDPSAKDVQMFDWIVASTGYEPIVVLTKLDKLKRSQVDAHVEAVRRGLNASEDCLLLPFSALNKQGLPEIYQVLDAVLEAPDPEAGEDGSLQEDGAAAAQ